MREEGRKGETHNKGKAKGNYGRKKRIERGRGSNINHTHMHPPSYTRTDTPTPTHTFLRYSSMAAIFGVIGLKSHYTNLSYVIML